MNPRLLFRIRPLLLSLLLGLPVAALPASAAQDDCLRVLTYNVNGLSGPVPTDVIIGDMQRLDADLIGLQEVYTVRGLADVFSDDSRRVLEQALREAGYRTWWSSYAGARPGLKPFFDTFITYEPGNLIAVRDDVFDILEEAETVQLSYYPRALGLGRENRVLQHVSLRWRATGEAIDFYNTHLTHRGRRSDERDTPLMEEVRRVRRILAERSRDDASIVFTADINLTPDNLGYRLLMDGDGTGPALTDTWMAVHSATAKRPPTLDPGNTFFSRHSLLDKLTGHTGGPPPLFLDYVLLGPADKTRLSVYSSEVVLKKQHDGYNYSDHYGVLSQNCQR